MSGRATPSWGFFSPHKYSPGGSNNVSKSPLSPFRYSEDSLRILSTDIEADTLTIPLNLPVSNSKQIRALPAHSRPQTSKCYSRMTSLPSSPLIHSPLNRNLSSPICLPSYQSSHGLSHSHGGGSLSTPARTIRDYDESQRESKKENFNLKLRIFFLEERLALGGENSNEKLISSNIDLKVQLEACKQELSEKLSLLVEASEALEHLDTQIKNESEEHKKEIEAMQEKCQDLEASSSKPSSCIANKSQNKTSPQRQRYLQKNNPEDLRNNNKEYLSTETMVLEVLEELEEFSKREKDFENKYNKKIQELKQSSSKTELDLKNIKQKLSEYEDEIESLNSNLDAKNDFIAALQENMREKIDEAQYFAMQLKNSSEVIKDQGQEIKFIKRRPQIKVINQKTQEDIKLFVQRMKTTGTNTESNDFTEIIKHLEDEILFKNQEINEFQSEIKIRDAKICNLEQGIQYLKSSEDIKMTRRHDQDGWTEKLELLQSDNARLDDQLKLQTHERKLLLKKISMLKDQMDSKCIQIDCCKKEDLENESAKKECKDADQQCDLDQSELILEAYKQNLSRFRRNTAALKKRLADSIESLQEFRKDHEEFVHMVEVIVKMDDINPSDEISNLVNDKRKIFEIQDENEDILLEDFDFYDTMSISNSSLSSDSSDNMKQFQTNILQHLKKETKEQNKTMKKNCSIIVQLEDELLIGDALTAGQVEIINDLKNDFEKMQSKRNVEKEENANTEGYYSWSYMDKIISSERLGLPLEYMQNSSLFAQEDTTSESENDDAYQDLDCLGDACLAEENKFLIDVLDLLAEEMDSCENIDSCVEMDYKAPQTKKGENLLNFCKNCSSCIQKDMHQMLKKLHYGLPCVLDQVKKLKYFHETLCKKSRKAFSESERSEQTLNDYHVLIAKLTSENLKMTGEKLVSKSEIEEIQNKNSRIIHKLEDEVCSLNSQLADKEVEVLKTKSGRSPRAFQRECFNRRVTKENTANKCSSPSTSDSSEHVQSPETFTKLSTNQKQRNFSYSHRPSTKLIRSDVRKPNDLDCSSDSENNKNNKVANFGDTLNTYKILEKNREVLDNKIILTVPKKIPSRSIRKEPRTFRRFSDS